MKCNFLVILQCVTGILTSLTWYGSLVLGSSQFREMTQPAWKNVSHFESGQKWPKNNHLTRLSLNPCYTWYNLQSWYYRLKNLSETFPTAFPPMPTGVVGHCSVLLDSNRFMVIGGNQGLGTGSTATFLVFCFSVMKFYVICFLTL